MRIPSSSASRPCSASTWRTARKRDAPRSGPADVRPPPPPARITSPPVEHDSAQAMLAALLDRYQPEGDAEVADVRAVRALTGAAADPYQRDLPLHVTASALIVHPPTARVLLR